MVMFITYDVQWSQQMQRLSFAITLKYPSFYCDAHLCILRLSWQEHDANIRIMGWGAWDFNGGLSHVHC